MALCGSKCLNVIYSKDDFVTCSGICKVKFHIACAKVPETTFAAMKKSPCPSISFRCVKCQAMENDTMIMFQKLCAKLDKIEEKQGDSFKNIEERIEKLEKIITEKTNDIVEVHDGEEISWSQVVKKRSNKPKRRSVVIVQPKDKAQKCDVTKESLKTAINPKDFDIRGVKNGSSGGIIIECADDDGCSKLKDELKSKLGDKLEAKMPIKRLPKVKVLRISGFEDKSDEELINELKNRNPIIENDDIKLIKREEVKNNGRNQNRLNAILQVTGETHKKLMNENRLLCGWDNCKVVDNVYIMRCYKCLGFSHKATECKNQHSSCSRCSSEHLVKEQCEAKVESCANCLRTNRFLRLNLDVNHNVWSNQCPVYQRKLEISRRAIHYVATITLRLFIIMHKV